MLLCVLLVIFFFKQKTAYEMRISDWSSDVCSSDLVRADGLFPRFDRRNLSTVFRHADRLDRVLGVAGADAHARAVRDFSQSARTRRPTQGELVHASNRLLLSWIQHTLSPYY